MRQVHFLTLAGLLLSSAALADTYSTTTSGLEYHGRGNRGYYHGFNVTTSPLEYHGRGNRGYYHGFHVTTSALIYRGQALSRLDHQGDLSDLPANTGLKARQIPSRLSSGSPLGTYKGPKTDKELNPAGHFSTQDAAGALLGSDEEPSGTSSPISSYNSGSDSVPAQEETQPDPAADDMAPEAPPAPPPEPEMPQ